MKNWEGCKKNLLNLGLSIMLTKKRIILNYQKKIAQSMMNTCWEPLSYLLELSPKQSKCGYQPRDNDVTETIY